MKVSGSLTKQLLSDDSVKTLSKNSGATNKQVEKVVSAALPILMQGMKNNSKTKTGAESLLSALSSHAADDTSDISAFLKNADAKDGDKIVKHVLGGSKTDIEKALAKKSGASGTEVKSILSNLAPVLLSLLGSEAQSSNTSSSGIGSLLGGLLGAEEEEEEDSGIDVGDIASLLLGGSSNSNSNTSSTGGILNLLLKVFGDD